MTMQDADSKDRSDLGLQIDVAFALTSMKLLPGKLRSIGGLKAASAYCCVEKTATVS